MNSNIVAEITALEEILDRESRALSGPANAKLSEIAVEKERILGSLAGIDYQSGSLPDLDKQVIARLKKCRQINEDNNLLLNQRLKVIRDVNQIVRQQTGNQNIELYDGGGRMVTTSTRKPLTAA